MPFLQLDAVVVTEFLARADRAQRFNVDAVLVIHGLAIGRAAVVDPAGTVALGGGIDHHAVIERKQKRMRAVIFGIALVRLLFGQALALVLDQPGAGRDARGGEYAFAMNAGTAHDEAAARLALSGCPLSRGGGVE